MYLTDRRKGSPRELNDHDELEILLETFSKQTEEIVNEAENAQVSAICGWPAVDFADLWYRPMYNPLRRSWS